MNDKPQEYLVEQIVGHEAQFSIYTWAQLLPMLRKNAETHEVYFIVYRLRYGKTPELLRIRRCKDLYWLEDQYDNYVEG